MRLEIEWLLFSSVVPAAIAAGLWLLSRRFLAASLAERAGTAWAIAVGWVVPFWLLPWTPWQPAEAWHWLPYLSLLAAITGPAGRAGGVSVVELLFLRIVLAAAAAWFLVPTWGEFEAIRSVYFAALGGLLLALSLLLEPLARRFSSGTLPLLLALVSFGGSAVLLLSGNMKFAQLAATLGSALGGCAVVCYFQPGFQLAAGMPFFVIVLGGLMFTGKVYSYSSVPTISYVLIPFAPLGLWVGGVRVGWLGARFWSALGFCAVALLVLIAIGMAIKAEA